MGIVGDGGGDCTLLEPYSVYKAESDMTGVLVAFNNGKLENILFGVNAVVCAEVNVKQGFLGDELVFYKLNHTAFANAGGGNMEILFAEGRKVKGV